MAKAKRSIPTEAINLYREGLSLQAVEDRTGFGREPLRRALKAMGEIRGRLDYWGPERDRLLANIRKESSGCWIWIGQINNMGYGLARYDGRRMTAQRAIYMLLGGKLDPSLDLCHSCDNPPCVNPDHLFPGTRKDNMQDASRKGRLAVGEQKPTAKLTNAEVLEIRFLHAGGMVQRRIAERIGVNYRTINSIVKGRSWRSVI